MDLELEASLTAHGVFDDNADTQACIFSAHGCA